VSTDTVDRPIFEPLPEEFKEFLESESYFFPIGIPGNRWVALTKFMFTTAIIVGSRDDRAGYSDRWCYHDTKEAFAAMVGCDWSRYPATEPTGWHRHPKSGRRINEETGELYVAE
jgi:hypothetical protein